MWFAKTASGFRGYLTLTDEFGHLVVGKESEYFIVTTVSPDDSGSDSAVVSESTQKPGLYFFDISVSFLLFHGAGNYGVVIEVDCPEVVDAFSSVLTISQADFDSLQSLGNAILGNVV